MPARASGGVSVRVTVTGKATTPDELSPATGEIAETLPTTSASSAPIVTVAVWPSLMSARSLSTTSVVTRKVGEAITMAGPDGASKPLWTLTAVTIPAIGALSAAALIWRWIA